MKYTVTILAEILVDTDIEADTIEEAVKKGQVIAKEFGILDETLTVVDGTCEVNSVYSSKGIK